MITRISLGAACAAMLFASIASAQPTQGNIVFASTGGLYYASATLGRRVAFSTTTLDFHSCQVNYNNGSVLTSDTTGRIYRVRATGTINTIAQLSQGWCGAMDLDQDRNMVMATGLYGAVRMFYTGSSQSVLRAYGHALNAICRNTKTGDFAVGSSTGPGHVMNLDRSTGAATTLTSLPGLPSGICYMPDVDLYAVSVLTTNAPLLLMTTSGATLRTIFLNGRGGSSVTYNENTRELFAGTQGGTIHRIDNAGNVMGSVLYSNDAIEGIDIWDDQNISLNTTGVAGSTVGVAVRFSRSPSRPYCLAVAFSIGAGIPISGAGHLNIAPDPLFFLTACKSIPGLTTGFIGTTNSTGGATGTFRLFPGLPSGSKIYCTGVAVNPTLPGGFDLGNTEVVRVD